MKKILLDIDKAIEIVRDSMEFIREYTGEIPGLTKEECGNYLEHSLSGAKKVAADMTEVLSDWTEQKLDY